jgi:hypothetical protein
MSKRSNDIRLRHMLDYAREAVALVEGRTREGLGCDRLLELALVRLSRSWEKLPDASQRKSVPGPAERRTNFQSGIRSAWIRMLSM